ncbi:hypothetical protein [Orientia tsutsugamushi]|uniref:hypothetical protein n=1 Tax=Orientia tsutsugamushi TaxID=784 RepID=UPI0013A56CDD|nr:hypothetical protein [Orientia tsutsugamushi]
MPLFIYYYYYYYLYSFHISILCTYFLRSCYTILPYSLALTILNAKVVSLAR